MIANFTPIDPNSCGDTSTQTLTGQFIRYTRSFACKHKYYLISQSHGSNSMQTWSKMTCWSWDWSSEWRGKEIWVALNVAWLFVQDGLVWHGQPSLGFTLLGCFTCRLRTGKWGYISDRFSKTGQWKMEKHFMVWWVLLSAATFRRKGQSFT